MSTYIVIYRAHNMLNMDTKHIGPFDCIYAAQRCLESLPALGACMEFDNHGCKYISTLYTAEEVSV